MKLFFLNRKLLFTSVLLSFILLSCKKDHDEHDDGNHGSIFGTISYDSANDGHTTHSHNPNIKGVKGAEVLIWYNKTTVADPNKGDQNNKATTDSLGKFKFSDLAMGDYYLYTKVTMNDSLKTVKTGSKTTAITGHEQSVEANITIL